MDTLDNEAAVWSTNPYGYAEEPVPRPTTAYWPSLDPGYLGADDAYVSLQEVDRYGSGYPPTPASSATFPPSRSYVYQPDDSAPSSTFAPSPYEIKPPLPYGNALNNAQSWFAAARESFLAAAQPQHSTCPPTPQIPYAPQLADHEIKTQQSSSSPCWSDSHPPPPTRNHISSSRETPFTPTTAGSRYASARNLFIVVPPAQNYSQSIRSSLPDSAAPGAYQPQLGNPFQQYPQVEYRDPSEYGIPSPVSSRYYPANPASLYPSPTQPMQPQFDAHTGFFTSLPSSSPVLVTSPIRPSRVLAAELYEPPSPPATPSLGSAVFPRALVSSGGQQTRPFPSVLAQSLSVDQGDTDTLGTSQSPSRATPTKLPKKRVRPSRAKPKHGGTSGESKPLRFINFTQKDSRALVSAVAPSGPLRASTKRKLSESGAGARP